MWGFGGMTGGSTNLAPGSRAWPVLAGNGGGSDGDRDWLCVKLNPGSDGFRMWPLPRTGGGGGGAFFLIDAILAVLLGGGIELDRLDWSGKAATTNINKLVMWLKQNKAD